MTRDRMFAHSFCYFLKPKVTVSEKQHKNGRIELTLHTEAVFGAVQEKVLSSCYGM
jgi:hypothetical protein